MKYGYDGFSSDYAMMDLGPLLILSLSWIWGGFTCDLCTMPDFQPNEYMFKKFADKGKERWMIYAWCLRDAMARAGDFKVSDLPVRIKFCFQHHLRNYK